MEFEYERKLNNRFPKRYAPKKTDVDFADVACGTKKMFV